jgi:predicted ArsR family transcriptional regulator
MTHTDRILTLLQDGPMSRGEIAKCLGLPPKKAQYVLVNMRDKGLVAQHEQSAVARYLSGAL